MNKTTKEARTKTENCLESFIQRLLKIKHDTGIEDVLDIGKYGSVCYVIQLWLITLDQSLIHSCHKLLKTERHLLH